VGGVDHSESLTSSRIVPSMTKRGGGRKITLDRGGPNGTGSQTLTSVILKGKMPLTEQKIGKKKKQREKKREEQGVQPSSDPGGGDQKGRGWDPKLEVYY